MKRALGAVAILLAAAGLFAGGVVLWGNRTFEEPGSLAQETVLVIPRGAGLQAIADDLERAGVIRYPLLFVAKARWTGTYRQLKAGEYAFAPKISPASVLEKIRRGDVVIHRITVPEGLTSHQVVALIDAAPALDGALPAVPPEGSLLPETYDYRYGDTRQWLVARMRKARDALLDALWQKRTAGLPLPDPEAAVILASIVEKETAEPAERPLVAAVFINRLRRGMRLQSDPTVVYALTDGKAPLGRRLTRSDLSMASPYNTYTTDGLPPGPIANPGAEALAAVLQPAQTQDLYFVADGNGGHTFARTLREHNRNVARWRRLLKQRRAAQ